MRKILLALAGLLVLSAPAEAQKTKAAITTEINSLFADNTSGQITPAKLRTVTTDIVNSYVDWLTCTSTGGVVFWSSGTPTCLSAGVAGQILQTNGSSLAPSWVDATTAIGILPVTNGGTGLPGGTSGGVPYFSSGSTMASSAALAANQVVLGGGAGAAPATLGSLGSTTTVLHGNAAGAPSFGAVVSADLNLTPTSCTNQFVSAISAAASGTCTAFVLAGAQFANQGTTTQVLHGNAAGNPSWGAVALGSDVSGVLGLSNGGTGTALVASNGGVVYSDATQLQLLAGTVTAGQCLLSGSSAAPTWGSCAGGAAVASVTNSDGTLTVSPTTGAVVASLNTGHANSWTAAQTFDSSAAKIKGSSTGVTSLASANSSATNYTATLPALTGTVSLVVASGAKALATSAISSGTCSAAQTATATGTLTTDTIEATFAADPTSTTGYSPSTTGMLAIISYPTADTVNFKVCNNTMASITPGAVTLNWKVRR